MRRICWWLVDMASRVLQPDERDAVLGDFAESGESGGEALCGLLGLIVRRQAALWKDWRPWLALVGLIVPLAWLLSVASRLAAGLSAVYVWSYVNNWDWALLTYGSFWYVLRDSATAVFAGYAKLVCWSWSAGFLLGFVSRRIMPVNVVLFMLAQVLGVSRYLTGWFQSAAPRPLPADPNGPVFALAFYREVWPVIVLAVLVVVPAVWAMRRGAGLSGLPRLARVGFLAAASVTVIAMAIQEPGLGFFLRAHRQLAILHGWPIRLLQFVVYWPVGYLVVSAMRRRWHGRVRPI